MRGMRLVAIAAAAAMLASCEAPSSALEAGFASFHAPARCISDTGAPGAGVITRDGCAETRWRIEPSATAGPRALYTITSLANGLCLEMPAAIGALVRMEPCTGGAAQRVMINGFHNAPSAGAFDVVHTNIESDLGEFPGLIVQVAAGCLGAEANGAVSLQACVDPVTGRFNPFTEWTLSPKPDAD